MTEAVIHIPEKLHGILVAYKKGEGVNIRKQIEILVKENPRYADYVKEASR